MQVLQRLILKGCGRCQGDLVLDKDVPPTDGVVAYECLQCGRTARFVLQPADVHEEVAA
jgi:hypothetical protein